MPVRSLPFFVQPKAQWADLVAGAGIPVPERWASFDAALRSGQPFIARSEHPWEFAGESGILESFAVTPSVIETSLGLQGPVPQKGSTFSEMVKMREYALKNRLQGGIDRDFELGIATSNPRRLAEYCRLHGLSQSDFLTDVSYSYWKLLGGFNRTIVADDAVPGRYHIFTTQADDPKSGYNYAVVEGGACVFNEGFGINPDMIVRGAAQAVGFYESVRQLPFFDSRHCPIIECQLVNGLHYFLQYHVGRDSSPANFELMRSPTDGEVEAVFVRGATPPEGIVVQSAVYYPADGKILEPQEDASFDQHYNRVFSEIMSRRRMVQFIGNKRSFEEIAGSSWNAHLPRSLLFKPRVSVAGNFRTLLTPELRDELIRRTKAEGKPARVSLRVISDGRRALIRRVDDGQN